MEQPLSFIVKRMEHKIYKLQKVLYGLKQAPRAWYGKIDRYFLNHNFQNSASEATLHVKTQCIDEILIVCLYVDDMIYTGNSSEMIKQFKKSMMLNFEMSDMGLLHYFLGIEVIQDTNGIFIFHNKHA